jgi:hypothetical protein
MARLVLVLVLVTGCTSEKPEASVDANAPPLPGRVTCGNLDAPSFPLAVLNQAAGVDPAADQPAAILHATLRETEGLPEGEGLPGEGWIRAAQTDDVVLFVARAQGMAWSMVKVERRDGVWSTDGYGACNLQPDVPDGMNLAVFRLSPDAELMPETTEVDLLVTELACNSGQDARGRIRVLDLVPAADTVTVIIAVVPRPGGHDCPGNPATPFTLSLPEPLGDRVILDGSEVPPRDAALCPARICPVP